MRSANFRDKVHWIRLLGCRQRAMENNNNNNKMIQKCVDENSPSLWLPFMVGHNRNMSDSVICGSNY